MTVVISERKKLISQDLAKVGRGALIAGTGAFIFYLLEALSVVDFGEQATPIIVAVLGVVANFVRKWWSENKY